MNYWVFKCDREKYKLNDRLADSAKPITWRVTRYADEIKPGDVAFISQTCPGPGIRAVIEIQSNPTVRAELQSERKFWINPPILECRVEGILTKRCDVISFKALRNAGLTNLSIYSRERATNFMLTHAEGRTIMGLIP